MRSTFLATRLLKEDDFEIFTPRTKGHTDNSRRHLKQCTELFLASNFISNNPLIKGFPSYLIILITPKK